MTRITLIGLGSIAVLALTGGDASAQRAAVRGPGAGYPAPSAVTPPGIAPPLPQFRVPPPPRPSYAVADSRNTGVDPSGRYSGYRRPYPGGALPPYWNAPRFTVADWSSYGLSRPGAGYRWTRYYDDAVLIDRNGSVIDSRGGIDWGHQSDGYRGSGYDDRRGAMVDGDGYSRGQMYGDRGADYSPPTSRYYPERGSRYVSPDGATVITTTSGDMTPGYYSDGYGGGVTSVTVRGAPSVTTTTTENYVDRAYTRSRPHRVYRGKRLYRYRAN